MCVILIKMSIVNKSSQTEDLFKELDNVGVKDFLVEFAVGDRVTSQVLLGNLVRRWHADICYTSLGHSLLLFLNPNKPLSIYSSEVKAIYSEYRSSSITPPPHIYSLINNMLSSGLSTASREQTLLFSGESGSGKSTNLYHALDYLRYLDNNNVGRLGDLIFNHNLILNIFGGVEKDATKFIKVLGLDFDFCGRIVGGGFGSYHLEKWRLCGNLVTMTTTKTKAINSGQQNFNIFYILIGGCDAQLLKSLHLTRNHDNYKILIKPPNLQGNTTLPFNCQIMNSHEQAFGFLKKHLPLSPPELADLFRILAAILHLGNVSFSVMTNLDGRREQGVEYGGGSLSGGVVIATLLGLPTSPLDHFHDDHDHAHSTPNRPLASLLHNLYTRLFSWLTKKLGQHHGNSSHFTINFLDFPGFTMETATVTTETIVNNYINERITGALVDVKLRLHQEAAIKDGVEWILIDTRASGCDWVGWVEGVCLQETELNEPPTLCNHTPSPTTTPTHQFPRKPGPHPHPLPPCFPTKNAPDFLPPALLQLLAASSNTIVAELYRPHPLTPAHPPQPLLPSFPLLQLTLNNLLAKLSPTTPVYLRCLKPSTVVMATGIEPGYLKHQLAHHRVLDTYKVFQQCYYRSWAFSVFLRRFRLLSLKTWPSCLETRENCGLLLGDLGFVVGRDYFLGNRGVYVKSEGVLLDLETYRSERLDDLALLLQKTFRCHRNRRRYLAMKSAQLIISRSWRRYHRNKSEVRVGEVRRMRRSVVVIQRCYIRWKRLIYLRQLTMEIPALTSPINKYWPVVPSYLMETNSLLLILFHRWRCRLYRTSLTTSSTCSPSDRLRLNEKSMAAEIFKGKKASYGRSVSHPFLGDYIRLRQNSQWRRNTRSISMETSNIVFADLVNKVARSSGKLLPSVLVLTTTSLLLLDPRTLQIKYSIHPATIRQVSMSTWNDDFVVVHVAMGDVEEAPSYGNQPHLEPPQNCLCSIPMETPVSYDTKGDLFLHAVHLVEFVTKLVLVCGNHLRKGGCHGNHNDVGSRHGDEVVVPSRVPVVFANQIPLLTPIPMTITFHGNPSTINASELIPQSQLKVKKKGGRLEVGW